MAQYYYAYIDVMIDLQKQSFLKRFILGFNDLTTLGSRLPPAGMTERKTNN